MFPEPSNTVWDSIFMAQEIINRQSDKKYSLEMLLDCVERAFYKGVIACSKRDLLQDSNGIVLVEESAKRYVRKLLADLENKTGIL